MSESTIWPTLRASEEKAGALKADINHLEQVMRMYRADWTGEGVKPRRRLTRRAT